MDEARKVKSRPSLFFGGRHSENTRPRRPTDQHRDKGGDDEAGHSVVSALRSIFRRQYFLHNDIINEVSPSDVG